MNTWEVTQDCDWNSGIQLPRIGEDPCLAIKTGGTRYQCTRAAGHTGRHAATGSPALGHKECPLYAVWSTP